MAILNSVETVEANEVWKSPDGKIKIFEVTLLYEGKHIKTQTFSGQVATVGFKGDLETYDKKDKTYVRQQQNEQFSSYGGNRQSGGTSKPAVMDNRTMYTSYAKDVAVALINSGRTLEAEVMEEAMAMIATSGLLLRDAVEQTEAVPPQVKEVFGDIKVDDQEVVSQVELDDIL